LLLWTQPVGWMELYKFTLSIIHKINATLLSFSNCLIVQAEMIPHWWEQATSRLMPWPIPRTTLNRSSNGSRTFAQLCRKLPIILRLRPQNYPFHGPIPKPNACLIPGPSDIPSASAILPQYTEETNRRKHRATDGWRKCLMTISCFRCIESTAATHAPWLPPARIMMITSHV